MKLLLLCCDNDTQTGSNLLVYRSCMCRSVLECGPCCTYSVELSDFDFVRRCSKVYRRCTLHPVKRKSHEELVHFIDGTPGYRAAPEVLYLCACMKHQCNYCRNIGRHAIVKALTLWARGSMFGHLVFFLLMSFMVGLIDIVLFLR